MPGPWEKYGGATVSNGPWSRYGATDTQAQIQPEVSQLESAARGLGQGATFGFSDEALAGLKSLAGGDYEKLLQEERAANEAARKANPLTYGASELGGGVATSFIPGIGMAKGAGLARNVLSAASMGALSGAGYANGDLEDRAKSAAIGGGVGGALGAVGHGITSGMQKIAPRLAETATGATGKELSTKFKPGSGEQLLDRGTVGWFDTPSTIAKKAGEELSNASNDIGNSLKSIDPVSKDQIMANLFTERAKLSGNEANASAIQKLDREISRFSKSPASREAQDIWNVKKSFESKVNWLARQANPEKAQADATVASALRNAVTDVAADQSPELAQKFANERQLYSLYAPIKEAAERKAATLQQRDIGGLLDTGAAIAGAGYGYSKGESAPGAIATGLSAAAGRRFLVPRIPAFLANLTNSNTAQQIGLRTGTAALQPALSSYNKMINQEQQ